MGGGTPCTSSCVCQPASPHSLCPKEISAPAAVTGIKIKIDARGVCPIRFAQGIQLSIAKKVGHLFLMRAGVTDFDSPDKVRLAAAMRFKALLAEDAGSRWCFKAGRTGSREFRGCSAGGCTGPSAGQRARCCARQEWCPSPDGMQPEPGHSPGEPWPGCPLP